MSGTLFKPGFWHGLLTVVAALLLWQVISLFFLPAFLPGPIVLLDRVWLVYGDASTYLVVGQTVLRILEGLVLSMVIGTALGLLMGLRKNFEAFLDSWIMVLLTFPAICWAFLAVLWFGLSEIAPILTIVLIVFPFVSMNVWEGTKAVEKNLIDMGRVYKANRRLMIWKVIIPQLMPYLFSALRIALSLSWKIALVGEAFGVSSGVGQQLTFWFEDTRVDMMLAWGISFMVLMVAIDLLAFRLWENRAFAWRHNFAT